MTTPDTSSVPDIASADLIEMLYSPAQLRAAGLTDTTSYRISTWRDDLVWQARTWIGAGKPLENGGAVLELRPVVARKGSSPGAVQIVISGIPVEARRLYAIDAGVVGVTIQSIVSIDGGATWEALRGPWRGTLSRSVARAGQVVVDLENRQDTDIDKGRVKIWGPGDAPAGDRGWDYVNSLLEGVPDRKWPP